MKVVVFGSYWDSASIQKVDKVAASLVVFVHSDSDVAKYPGVTTRVLDQSALAIGVHESWLSHLYKRDTSAATDEDEAFHRGMLVRYAGSCLDETLQKWVYSFDDDNTLRQSAIEFGKSIVEYNNYLAKETVKANSLDVYVGKSIGQKYRARLVISGPILVMPVVMAAAKDYDVGINMRQGADGNTRFTFFTRNSDNIDLSFVNQAPFNGGGKPYCKGCSVARTVDVTTIGAEAWLETMLE
jgi:hypothetical protein